MYVNVIGKIYSTEEDYKRYCKTNDDYHIVNHTQFFFPFFPYNGLEICGWMSLF